MLVLSDKTLLGVRYEALKNENVKFRLSLRMQIVFPEFKNKLKSIQKFIIK